MSWCKSTKTIFNMILSLTVQVYIYIYISCKFKNNIMIKLIEVIITTVCVTCVLIMPQCNDVIIYL